LLANFWEWTMRKKFAHKGGRCRFSSMNPAAPLESGKLAAKPAALPNSPD
jgi:hypothetical protein